MPEATPNTLPNTSKANGQKPFTFTIEAQCPHTGARAGVLHTPHGPVHTPVFMPVGTRASVKGLDIRELNDMSADIILANTYHLHLRPGSQLVAQQGGLQHWTRWQKPMLTDSGGFQVFSLSATRQMTEEGVTFASVLDGSPQQLTPESSISVQMDLGADIIMAFDECTPNEADYTYAKNSMERTHRWLDRCVAQWQSRGQTSASGHAQALFPIIQGGKYEDLRMQSVKYMADAGLPGIAIGGIMFVGQDAAPMYQMLDKMMPHIPADRPRYLMGLGEVDNLLETLSRGLDMWDCVLPTRLGRHGVAITSRGKVNMKKQEHRDSTEPLDASCPCHVCTTYTRSYLRHLVAVGEMSGLRFLSYHNTFFLTRLIQQARAAILGGNFVQWRDATLAQYRGQA